MKTTAYWVVTLGVALVFGTTATTLGWDRPSTGLKSRTKIKRQDSKKRVRHSAPKSVKRRSSSGKGIHSVTHKALSKSYKRSQQDLKAHANKIKELNRIKQKTRERTRDVKRKLGKSSETATGSAKPTKAPAGPKMVVDKSQQVAIPSGKPQGSVGDDAQLKNVDLQNQLKKQQETTQRLSNMSKALKEAAEAIIEKMGP